MKQIYKNIALLVMMGAAFVGCNKKVDNPKPSVTALSSNGYVSDSKKVKPNTTLKFGFDAASNAETNKDLTKFRMFISDGTNVIYDTVFNLNNEKSFHCEGEFTFVEYGKWQIVGRAFDAANEEGSEYIDITVLMEDPFTWKQVGFGEVEGFGEYGLIWNDTIATDTICLFPANADSIQILNLSTLEWNNVNTEANKRYLFSEIARNYGKPNDAYKDNRIDVYKSILTNKESVTYNEVIAVWNMSDSEKNLLLYITNSFAEEYNGEVHLTVHGKVK